jgi:hypothetical protein
MAIPIDILKAIFDPLAYRTPYEFKGAFKGHQVAVRLSSKELKLYIDGSGVDSVPPFTFPKKDVTLVRGPINDGEQVHIVEVYGRTGFRRPKIKICVDGQKIAGDDF